jgi:hypothetical protein
MNMDELSNEIQSEIMDSITEIIEEYIDDHALIFSKKKYLDVFVDHISTFVIELAKLEGWYVPGEEDRLEELIRSRCIEVFEFGLIPLRENSPYIPFQMEKKDLKKIIAAVNSAPVQKQRTMDWFIIRNNLFSASNIWKLFSTESQYNSLIYEKCKSIDIRKVDNQDLLALNPRNWGIKYEPLSVMLYEYKNSTKVNTNYGCIPHKTLPVGASPDGVVCDETSLKYGHLVEIKNIFNRDIDGIPSEEYWIQIQTQLEVCCLEICDFVETRFKEFESYDQYCDDVDHEYKGITLFFIPRQFSNENESMFQYMPIDLGKEPTEAQYKWIENIKTNLANTHILYQTSYWYLDEYSCVEVIRNDLWFSRAIPIIEKSWGIVLKERVEGYEHRAPQKRRPSITIEEATNQSKIPDKIQVIKMDSV